MIQFQTSTKFQVHLLHYTTEISRQKKKRTLKVCGMTLKPD